jgi:iron complex transport system ATP-binding protein
MLGPNGAGKSTLIKLMLAMLTPAPGSITIDGDSVHRMSADRRAAWVSYVPQRSSAAFAFSVKQVVSMGRYSLRHDEAAIGAAIEACDLTSLVDRPFMELSVGQQQRVLLARAMAQASGEGKVMLLDEPTSAMDLAHVHQTMQRLRRLADSGLAVVVVMQDINLAARYADRVWLLSGGKLIADGDWSSVLKPELLEPVYGVQITRAVGGRERPLFDVQLLGH